MNIPKPEAVIFDMDGLLVDSERQSRKASQRAAAEFDYEITDDLYLEMVGRAPDEIYQLFLDTFGNDFPLEGYQKHRNRFLKAIEQEQGVPFQPGVQSILTYLGALEMTCSVVTNSKREDAEARLNGIRKNFHSITARDEARRNKPHPDPYLLAVSKLKLDSAKCLVLEDTDTGALAAHAAGINVIIVPDLKQPSKEAAGKAIAVCNSLIEVEKLFRKSWGQ